MPHAAPPLFRHVKSLWDSSRAAALDPVQRLVYRSNLLGADTRITNTGGGNTSSKVAGADPLSGAPVNVLWVKGSGGDLGTARRESFASLDLDRIEALQAIYATAPDRGAKSAGEDRMVGYYPHCTFGLNPTPCSIDTPLHAFVPARHVDHTHPNAVIAVAAAARSRELTKEIYGDDVGWLPWQRPGFDLGLRLRDHCRAHPQQRGVVLGGHGLINWADDDGECYHTTLELIERAADFIERHERGTKTFGGQRCEALPPQRRDEVLAAVLPWLRGRLSTTLRMVATVHADESIMRFVDSADAQRLAGLGTSCPDHFLRTKIKPLYVGWDPGAAHLDVLKESLAAGLEQYRRDYQQYYERSRGPDSPAMRDPSPTVILIPGAGMIAWGKSKAESRITAEFYACAVEVMRGAEVIDRYTALPAQEAFDIEYWALEEAKLRRLPPQRDLAGSVALVAGAGSGIGRAAAQRLAGEGASIVCADRDTAAAEATAAGVVERQGAGGGVAGTGIARCGPAVGVTVDLTDRAAVRAMLRDAVLAYGGVDHLVITAGMYPSPDAQGRVSDEQWRATFAVNVLAAHVLADECRAIWDAQGLAGTLVLVTSVNAVVPKPGSFAYDTSKAAANHLVRELAVALAPRIRVNGVAPATVVEGSAMFPRDRVMASLRRYEIPFAQDESTEVLRQKLAAFYAQRTLLKAPITLDDQAEAILFLVSRRSAKTTGQVLTVDGGLAEAFLR